ncbi:MAG TPA: ABC transporter permease [Candidatus Saccharimonadales bacterium]|nr:ABC transporter permease [Candidatus Saccharimonadales bacterium]
MIKQIFPPKNRALLAELVRTDFKLRYQGSILGYAWSLLRPLMLFLILYLVFAKFIKLGTGVPHYPIYLLLGIVLWNFFNEMTMQSLGSIVNRGDLIRKIRIPRWIIVISTSLAALINLGLNLIVVAIFMYFNHVDILRTGLFLPFIIIEIYILALGASLFLAAAYVKYRDVVYIWEVGMQAAFYVTPIIYPLSRIKNPTLLKVLLSNPMAQAIQDARYSLVTHQTAIIGNVIHVPWARAIPYSIVVMVLVIGVLYFRREAKYFAENI